MKYAAPRGYTYAMMLRRPIAALAVFAVLSVSAAAQGVKVAGDPAAAPAAPAADAPKAEAPKKAASKPGKKKGDGAKRKKREVESKYKSRILTDGAESSYRFDENGNPLGGAEKKKSSAAPKKKSSEPAEAKAACADDDSCSDKDKKSSDADAL